MSVAMRQVSRYWFLAYSKLMSMTWEWSDAVPYGATDGRRLLLSRSGMNKLANMSNGSGLLAFLLVHEAMHALLGHGWRCTKMQDKTLANVAADYIINAMIKMRNDELGREVFPFIEGVLLDESLSGDKSVEQLYREMTRPQPPQPQPEPEPEDNNDNDTNNDNDNQEKDGDASCDAGEDEAEGDGDAGGEAQDSETADSGADGDAGDSDAGSDGDDGGDAGSGGGGGVTGGDAADGGKPSGGAADPDDLSDFVGTGALDTFEPELEEGESEQEAREKIEQDNDRILIADEIDRRTSGEGGVTGRRAASQRVDAEQLDWAVLCREWLMKRKRDGWDSPFNPAIHGSTGLVCAGRRSRKAGTVVMALDSSGSIGALTYTKFLQQAQSVLDELKPELMVLLSVSHVVADSYLLEQGDMAPTMMNGGGGTAFKPAFDWLENNSIEPDVMIYLTDGESYDRTSLRPVDYPLLWLSTRKKAADYPIGEVLEITNM